MTKLWGLRWWMMGLLMVGSTVNYLTRSTLSVASANILKDLHIGAEQYSWIVSGFQFAIMLQPICGYVMDTLGLKLGFAFYVWVGRDHPSPTVRGVSWVAAVSQLIVVLVPAGVVVVGVLALVLVVVLAAVALAVLLLDRR